MADAGQVLATGATTIVGVAVGAGLTYLFGTLNRRHQEAREDRTRWYEERLKAYVEFTQAGFVAGFIIREGSTENMSRVLERFQSAIGTMMLLGSREVQSAGRKVLSLYLDRDATNFSHALAQFTAIAGRDLGHPPPKA